jgi:hypothetical protein
MRLKQLLLASSAIVREQYTTYRWRTAIGALVILLSTLPHIVGWTNTPPGERYLARGPVVAGDTMVYYAAMEEAAAGKFFTTNPFTVEQQSPRLVQPIWLIGGLLMRVTGLPVEVVFQIYRIIAAVFFMA